MTTEHSNGIARINPRLALEPRDRSEAREMAEVAVRCGYYGLRTAEEALIILMTGRELGLTTTQSLRGIYVVKGKPMVSADAMVACVVADPRCEYWQPVESTSERCVIRVKRRGMPEPVTGIFTMEDAKAAQLTGSDMYRKYPRVMLRHRCAAELVREVFPDVILGIYCEGEIDGVAPPSGFVTEPVSIIRDSAPALNAAPDALTAFRLDLADVTDCRSLTACWQSHAQALHAASDQDTARLDVAARMTALRYALTGAETTALLGGTMHSAYATALDALTEIERGDLDEDGDAVIADVVRVLRAAGDAPSASKGHIATASIKRATALGVADAKTRITAALKPPPPTKPTGTDAPTASAPASSDGGSVAPSQSAGAQASANDGPRCELTPEETEARYLRDDAVGAEAWASHLAACVGVFAMAGAHAKRVEAFRAAGVLAARRGATLAAIEAREGKGADRARECLDGYRTRQVVPIGASVRARSHREQVAARTGTEG